MFITQPALSHYISKVEKEIGIPLFQRTTTAVTLAGEKYVTAAKKILQISNNLREKLSDIAALKNGRIVIGIPPARAAYILPHIVPQFMKKYLGVQLKTLEKNSHILKEAILTGKKNQQFGKYYCSSLLIILFVIENFSSHLPDKVK